jgi:alkylation response protein AidB-like acyl-CoA dehydrogenase
VAYRYAAPLADMRFALDAVLQAPRSWQACPPFADLDGDTAAAVLEEAARLASGVLQPINAAADLQGCTLDAAGQVHTPAGYRQAYQAFVDGGWPALPCSPDWGGQGLPLLLDAAVREMLSACNHAWNMYPDLLHGAYETLKAHGSSELQARYLADIASGRTLAAMALTEPQAGSDLGALRTRAEPQADGSLRISGQKIFISGGDHDLTPQIVHLVLCRLPDAPPGSKGLSLALVPKWLPDGTRNAMHCDGIEKKMGIKGSATCAMRYEAATGWLVGQPHKGLAAMFLMMNSARLHVGLQGLGHQEMATQNALRHAAEREQFRSPIAQMPAMRHALLRLQVCTETHRLLAYRAALALDEAAHHADPAQRARQGRAAALLTPVVKAACTRQGFDSASAALQVFGGYGYTHDYGVEQTLRDARIAMVYEGTNEIQAIDLLQRKVLADGGQALFELLDELDAEASRCAAQESLADFAQALSAQTAAARAASQGLLAWQADAAARAADAPADRDRPLRVADDYLAGLTHTLMAWAMAASARAAVACSDGAFAQAKTQRMRYGVQWLLPEAALHWARVADGGLALPLVRMPQ